MPLVACMDMASSRSKDHNIILFRGWADKSRYVWSPFVTKLELRLRLANVIYTTDAGSARHAPKGKVPYIEFDQDSGRTAIGDSALIAKRFEDIGIIEDMNARLEAAGKAQDLALRALMEDRLYFFNVRVAAALFLASEV